MPERHTIPITDALRERFPVLPFRRQERGDSAEGERAPVLRIAESTVRNFNLISGYSCVIASQGGVCVEE